MADIAACLVLGLGAMGLAVLTGLLGLKGNPWPRLLGIGFLYVTLVPAALFLVALAAMWIGAELGYVMLPVPT